MSAQWDGRPINPERDGWHWVGGPGGSMSVHFWMGDIQRWETASGSTWTTEYFAARASYLGPCLTPAGLAAAVQAERERVREAIWKAIDAKGDIAGHIRDATERQEARAKAFWEISRFVRALDLGDTTDALAARIAEARREGMEEALQIARDAQSFVVYERIQHAIRAAMKEQGE